MMFCQIVTIVAIHADIHAGFPQQPYIVIKAFSAGRNIFGSQFVNQLMYGQRSTAVGFIAENLCQTEQLKFLMFAFSYGGSPRFLLVFLLRRLFMEERSTDKPLYSVYYILKKMQEMFSYCGVI